MFLKFLIIKIIIRPLPTCVSSPRETRFPRSLLPGPQKRVCACARRLRFLRANPSGSRAASHLPGPRKHVCACARGLGFPRANPESSRAASCLSLRGVSAHARTCPGARLSSRANPKSWALGRDLLTESHPTADDVGRVDTGSASSGPGCLSSLRTWSAPMTCLKAERTSKSISRRRRA